MKRGYVSDEKFVRAWNKATCLSELKIITGLRSHSYIYARARALRKLGVELPHYVPRNKVYDVHTLNEAGREEREARDARMSRLR